MCRADLNKKGQKSVLNSGDSEVVELNQTGNGCKEAFAIATI